MLAAQHLFPPIVAPLQKVPLYIPVLPSGAFVALAPKVAPLLQNLLMNGRGTTEVPLGVTWSLKSPGSVRTKLHGPCWKRILGALEARQRVRGGTCAVLQSSILPRARQGAGKLPRFPQLHCLLGDMQ